jgi:chromosome segregation ATPase
MTIESDVAKVREFIEHEREMRECCSDLPDDICAPIHAEAALSRIEAALREAQARANALDEQYKGDAQMFANLQAERADLRRQLAAAKASDSDLRQELSEIGHRVARLDAIGALKETL